MTRRVRIGIIVGAAVFTAVGLLFVPPIPQDLTYHNFADTRSWAGIPNFGDVASNVPFVLAGILGLGMWFRHKEDPVRFASPAEKIPLLIAYLGFLLVGPGSGYYHWNPNNAALVWDRLPMTFGFMALFAMVIAERIDVKTGIRLLPVLILLGMASVFYWDITESAGRGDLRLYAWVQFFPAIAIPLMLVLFPSRYTGTRYLVWMIVWYAAAKVLEHFDKEIFALLNHAVSGHTLKHLAAALAAYELVRYLRGRRKI